MKKLIILNLLLLFSFSILQAQIETENKTQSKVIIKKITIEKINGKEIEKEEIDTIEMPGIENITLPEKNIEVIIKDVNGKESYETNDEDIIIMKDLEGTGMDWEESEEFQNELSPNKAVLGVQLNNVEGENGAQIQEIFEGSAAEKIGLQKGDILLSIDGKATKNVEDVINSLSDNKVGDKVKVTYLRETKIKTTKATLQERKEEAIKIKSCHSDIGNKKIICYKTGPTCSKSNKCIITKDKDGKVICHDIKGDSKSNKKIIKFKHGNEDLKRIERIGEPEEMEIKEIMDQRTKEVNKSSGESQSLNVEYLASSPNPSNGHMKINFSGLKIPTTIKVIDLNGKEIYSEKLDNFDGIYNKEINIKNEAKGTLILKIIQGDKIISQKLIVE